MERINKTVTYILMPILIFLFAYILRRHFFCGFILGDDAEEYALLKHLMIHGPNLEDHLQYRFGIWLFNLTFIKLFGLSEEVFFLPTWVMSASLSVIAYYILLLWQYRISHAFLASLFVASAPFEVLIGTVRANDLIFSWVLALSFIFLILLEKRPGLQGIVLTFLLWFAFYVKLWVIYLFPALGLYYLLRLPRYKIWHGLFNFSITTLFLHGIQVSFGKLKWTPFCLL